MMCFNSGRQSVTHRQNETIRRQTIRRTDRQNSISTALSESGVTKIFNMKLIPSYIKMIISVMAAYLNS